MFNEPDNVDVGAGCGGHINAKGGSFAQWFTNQDWTSIGIYLADQYALYHDAIKQADPSARVFSLASLQLPMPGFGVVAWPGSIELWSAFLNRLAATGHSLDGIAIHAYPNNASTLHLPGCVDKHWLDHACVEDTLSAAYRFFQGTDASPSHNPHPELTRNKPIWLTETGVLAEKDASADGRLLSSGRVSEEYLKPLVAWFNAHTKTGQDAAYINSMAWYVTFSGDDGTPYTDLLVDPVSGTLTSVGVAWRDATCPLCECPGCDCR